MINSINWVEIDLHNMILICMKHGEPFEAGGECKLYIEDEMLSLKDDLYEGQMRKLWEKRHRKTLGK